MINWQEIKVAENNREFLYNNQKLFNREFIEILKFHSPGLAPVKDHSGAFHITKEGIDLYPQRYDRTFGFYNNRAAVIIDNKWFHINEKGEKVYKDSYAWTGNFQENKSTVRDFENNYFHIDMNGVRIYSENYLYCGDYKDNIACVKLKSCIWRHINILGEYLNDKDFLDLGVFHKNIATARDEKGWFHIDRNGTELYSEKYLVIEPFYNGFALVTNFDFSKQIINEKGQIVHTI